MHQHLIIVKIREVCGQTQHKQTSNTNNIQPSVSKLLIERSIQSVTSHPITESYNICKKAKETLT